jgi:hypothetical protein
MTQEEFQAHVFERFNRIEAELKLIHVEVKAYWDTAKLILALAFTVIGATSVAILVQAFIHHG